MKYIKNYIQILLIFILSTFMWGCDDFLEEDVRDRLTPENFFTSDAQAVLAVNGIYRQIFVSDQIYGSLRGIFSFTTTGTDDVATNRKVSPTPLNDVMHAYRISETNFEEAGIVWRQAYLAINAANATIIGINENRENLTDEIADRCIGEAIFLRALMYYHLTNQWGDVPYLDGAFDVVGNAEIGRIDKTFIREEQVKLLTQIEEDDLLPNTYAQAGYRVTAGAAKMLKVKFLMWLEDYDDALKNAEDITNSGRYSLLPNFEDVFRKGEFQETGDIYHAENIFGYDFNASAAEEDIVGSKTWRMFTPNTGEEQGYTGILPEGLSFQLGTSNVIAHPDFFDKFPEGSRKEATYSDGTDISTNNVAFPSGSIYLEKLWSLDINEKSGIVNGDFLLIFRYADLLLLAAEAAAELGQDGKARGFLEQVQTRGNAPSFVPSGASGQVLIQEIRDERAYELTGEGTRREDLIRWGILVETIRNVNPLPDQPELLQARNNIQDYHIFLPIPPNELRLNPQLLQDDPTNNGYR